VNPKLRFLEAGGEMAALMRAHDWSDSPLGPPAQWPQALRSVVSLMLASKFPMFVAWGPQLGFLYNDPYAEILGKKHPAALGRRFREIWEEIWDDVGPLAERALAGEATFQENLPLLMHRKGYDEQTWFTFSYSPVFDDDGEIAGMYCTCTETTAVVLASRHREREIERLHLMFQQAPGVIAVLREPEHVFELANDAYRRLVGTRDLIGKRVLEALPEVEGQGFVDLLDHVYRTGEPYVGRAVPVRLIRDRRGGLEERFVDFIYQPLRDEAGKVHGIFVEGSDVTDAVHTTQALRESEQRMLQLANTIPHLAWIAGPDGQVQWCNDRWYEFIGQARGAGSLPLEWQPIIHPDDLPRVMARWEASMRSGTPYECEMRLRRADGAWRLFFGRAAPMRDADGNVVQWFGTNTDITEAHLAREALLDAGRRKDEFLAMLAHELRNPLAPVRTAANLLGRISHGDPRVQRASEVVSRQVGHMVSLVDDLLDVSRVTRGLVDLKRERLAVDTIVADAIEQARPLLEARGHVLASEHAPRPLHVVGDRTRLTQVLANLLNNAAKYTPPGGRVTLRVKADGTDLVLSVRDNGIGIDADLLPRLFTLFAQAERAPDRSQGGLGIGLALAHSLVELHGGTLHAESDGPGTGACFVVRLPLAREPAPEAEKPAVVVAPARGTGCRVLLVDDNVDAATMLAELLTAMGYTVSSHENAEAALQDAQARRFDALVLDIGMPGLDGYELARRIRAGGASADALLVALTGYGQPQDRERSKAAGFDAHLVKPADAEQLLDLLAGACPS
jgi:PAS domain S-box-containing protein